MNKILIATSNLGKFKEIVSEFSDLDFKFLSLNDLKLDKIDLEEPFETTWENALHKAKFFAKKTGLPTIAEDTAFCINALHGAPGIKAKRFAPTEKERIEKVLKEMKNVKTEKRGAKFITHACLYYPKDDSFVVFKGEVLGEITKTATINYTPGLQYDSIFYYPPAKKVFAKMTVAEKNSVSHRGKILIQIKRFLLKNHSFKQYLVVGGIVVKDGKMLLTKRRDPRMEFNNKWEFPGGGVDNGEQVIHALKREVLEETGLTVEPLEQLPQIVARVEKKYNYQVFLLLYICKIIKGEFKASDTEVAGHGWFTLTQAMKLDSLPANLGVLKKNIGTLKKYINFK